MYGEEHGGSTRRRLLLGGVTAVTVGGNAAWMGSSIAAKGSVGDDENWISARIQAIELPDRVSITPSGSARAVSVLIADETDVNRDGRASLADFSVGDTVAVRLGAESGDAVRALNFHAFYHRFDDVEVVERADRQLSTGRGAMMLGDRAEVPERYGAGGRPIAAKALAEIRRGDRLSVLGRYEEDQNAFVVHYVRAE